MIATQTETTDANTNTHPVGVIPSILIVDDNPTNVKMVAHALNHSLKCTIFTAENGVQAVDMAIKNLPDLILMDGMMPLLDGFEATKKIKTNPNCEDIPIVFITAMTEKKEIIKAFDAGASDYIVKPFYPREMMARVHTHLTVKLQKDKIKRHVAEQRQLLHVLCHDLSNPIISARNVIELSQEDPSILQELSEEIKVALNNALNLIDLIREFKAIDEGKRRREITPVKLKEAIDEACLILRSRAEKKHIKLNNQTEQGILVLTDKTSFINSVINNLLTNAIKFSDAESHIDIFAQEFEKTVEVTIRDYGIGIPENQIESIFNLNAATSRPGTQDEQGTGFGMPLVQKFTQSYGGSVRIQSVERTSETSDHGTAVIITLNKSDTPSS